MKSDLSYTAEVAFLAYIVAKLLAIFKQFITSSNNHYPFNFLEIIEAAFDFEDTFRLRYLGAANIKNYIW